MTTFVELIHALEVLRCANWGKGLDFLKKHPAWHELTSPQTREALLRYIEICPLSSMNQWARTFYEELLKESYERSRLDDFIKEVEKP